MTFLRTWPALAAWGAGLTHLAVAAGSPAWLLALLALAGAVELAWGATVLRAGRVVMPRTTLFGALALVAGSTVLALTGAVGAGPFAAIGLLLLYVAGASGASIRSRGRRDRTGARTRGDGAAVLGLVLGATLVAGITTPALALTEPGTQAVPHGELPGGHAH